MPCIDLHQYLVFLELRSQEPPRRNTRKDMGTSNNNTYTRSDSRWLWLRPWVQNTDNTRCKDNCLVHWGICSPIARGHGRIRLEIIEVLGFGRTKREKKANAQNSRILNLLARSLLKFRHCGNRVKFGMKMWFLWFYDTSNLRRGSFFAFLLLVSFFSLVVVQFFEQRSFLLSEAKYYKWHLAGLAPVNEILYY